MLHHGLEELDDNLRAWAKDDLTLSTLLGVDNVSQGMRKSTNEHHLTTGCDGECECIVLAVV